MTFSLNLIRGMIKIFIEINIIYNKSEDIPVPRSPTSCFVQTIKFIIKFNFITFITIENIALIIIRFHNLTKIILNN